VQGVCTRARVVCMCVPVCSCVRFVGAHLLTPWVHLPKHEPDPTANQLCWLLAMLYAFVRACVCVRHMRLRICEGVRMREAHEAHEAAYA